MFSDLSLCSLRIHVRNNVNFKFFCRTLEDKYENDESFVEFLNLRQGSSPFSLEDLLTLPVSCCTTLHVTGTMAHKQGFSIFRSSSIIQGGFSSSQTIPKI